MLHGIIDIDRNSPVSLSEQIYRQIRFAVRDGKLKTGQRLTSSRNFARQLNVSRNVVSLAYDLLKAEAIITVKNGAAPIISKPEDPVKNRTSSGAQVKRLSAPTLSKRGQALCIDPRAGLKSSHHGHLAPGEPALDIFPTESWARCLRRVSRTVSPAAYLYQNVSGQPELQSVLAEHLLDMRGIRTAPGNILITTTTQASITLISQCLTDPGEAVFLENPGYLGARGSFQSAGLKSLALPVNRKGASLPRSMPAQQAKLIYLTPSHQFPLGHTLSLSRRLDFIDYARRENALILEDDYDSEFLFSGRPVAAMQALAPDCVIYMGTFSKTMLPGLRLAYMVVPPELSARLSQAIRNMGMMASVPIQLAMRDFITSGHYRAHIRHIRHIYKHRGETLFAGLKEALGETVKLTPPTGGVQLSVQFMDMRDDKTLASRLQAQGVNVTALSSTYLKQPKSGLIIGFADAKPENIERSITAIKKVLA